MVMKYFILLTVFFISSCSYFSRPVEYYGSADLPNVEILLGKAAVIRTYHCDIVAENIRKPEWDILRGYSFFRGKGSEYPYEPAFHLIISNTWNRPVTVEKVELKFEGSSQGAEFFETVQDKSFFNSRYNINLKELWKPRRILTEKNLLKDIDFNEDSIEYRFGFIAPGDRVSMFYLFNYVPLKAENFKLSVTIKYLNFKKVIDFDMKRFEYRETESKEDILY